MELVWSFLGENIPSWKLIGWLLPAGLIYGVLTLYVSGLLKTQKGWRTGYTRKIFHFSIFFGAGAVHVTQGFPGIIVFGSAVSLVIMYAVFRGDGHVMYEAMAREKDDPQRTYYILIPYLATLAGGCFSNLFFLPAGAFFGYLVTGLGDAIGEPFGTKFGKHKYRVPSLRGVSSYRSLEGSMAVFTASVIALLLAAVFSGIDLQMVIIGKLIAIGFICTLVEAVSPHGWDNFTLQMVASGAVYYLIL